MALRIALIVLALVIVAGGVFYYFRRFTAPVATPQKTTSSQLITSESNVPEPISGWQKVSAPGDVFTFQHPGDWFLSDTTPAGDIKGERGKIIKTWTLTSYEVTSIGQMVPPGGVKMEITIEEDESGEVDVDTSINCPTKSNDCDHVEINEQEYKRYEARLNNGLINIGLGKVKQGKIINVVVLMNPGEEVNQTLEKKVEEIFATFYAEDVKQ